MPGGEWTLESCTVIGKVHPADYPGERLPFLLPHWQRATAGKRPLGGNAANGAVSLFLIFRPDRAPHRYRCQPEKAIS